MRSLFWRILAAFWLALLLVAGLSILLGRALNQDTWIIARHPGLKDLAEQWTALYEEQGSYAAQACWSNAVATTGFPSRCSMKAASAWSTAPTCRAPTTARRAPATATCRASPGAS